MSLKISGVAIGQWKQLCKNPVKNDKEIEYKIIRSITLGQVTNIYNEDSCLIRCTDLNFLISNDIVMTMWRDKNFPLVKVPERLKRKFDKLFYSE